MMASHEGSAGRTYVVTGSASGIGAATATVLRRRGATVIGCDLDGAEIRVVVAVSSTASLAPTDEHIAQACLDGDEAAAVEYLAAAPRPAARRAVTVSRSAP